MINTTNGTVAHQYGPKQSAYVLHLYYSRIDSSSITVCAFVKMIFGGNSKITMQGLQRGQFSHQNKIKVINVLSLVSFTHFDTDQPGEKPLLIKLACTRICLYL